MGPSWLCLIVLMGCKGTTPPPVEGGAGQDVARVASSCSGTAQVSGSTPVGLFTVNTIYVQVDSSSCENPGSIRVQIVNEAFTEGVSFGILLQRDSGVGSILGQIPIDVGVFAPGLPSHGSVQTQGTLTLTAVDDPRIVDLNEGDTPVGGLSGTIELSQDGFSLSGSFQSPYCSLNICSPL